MINPITFVQFRNHLEQDTNNSKAFFIRFQFDDRTSNLYVRSYILAVVVKCRRELATSCDSIIQELSRSNKFDYAYPVLIRVDVCVACRGVRLILQYLGCSLGSLSALGTNSLKFHNIM